MKHLFLYFSSAEYKIEIQQYTLFKIKYMVRKKRSRKEKERSRERERKRERERVSERECKRRERENYSTKNTKNQL